MSTNHVLERRTIGRHAIEIPELSGELRLIVIYLLEAAKTHLLYGDKGPLTEALSAISKDEAEALQVQFPHLNIEYVLSAPEIFLQALASRHLAPSNYISSYWLLVACTLTKLDTEKVSENLVDDLMHRLRQYLLHCPSIIRIGIYSTWLKAEADSSIPQLLTDCVLNSNAPLLQKLVQMIGDASAACKTLQLVKDRIQPMSDRELAIVLDDAQVVELFDTFETTSIAAGSIGQGHLATLKDGTPVFVKVKRYDIGELMAEEAEIFNSPLEGQRFMEHSPWSQIAKDLVQETSFALEVANQQKLKSQWTQTANIDVVDVLSHHPELDPTILIMKIAPGTTMGRASIRFPIGLENAVKAMNALTHQFYAITLFYNGSGNGFAPADPHAANIMIDVDQMTGAVKITMIDTASICTIKPTQRDQIIDLFIAVLMSDPEGIAESLAIPYEDVYLFTKATQIYRHILQEREEGGKDSISLKKLIRCVEVTKLVLKRPALDDLLIFGKAQLQLLDTITQFATSHAYELEKLHLKFDSLIQVVVKQMTKNNSRNRAMIGRVAAAMRDSAGRRFKDSFTPWDWDADGKDGEKTWPFGA